MAQKLEGRAKRRSDRVKAAQRIQRDVEKLFRTSDLIASGEPELTFARGISEDEAIEFQQKIKAGLEAHYANSQRKRTAYLAHGQLWTKLMAEAGLHVPPELPAVEMTTPTTLFTPDWMARARVAKIWKDALNSKIARLGDNEPLETLIDLAITSSIFHGLLLNPSHVLALHETLSSHAVKLIKQPLWPPTIEFEVRPASGLVHNLGTEGGIALVAFAPDPVTLGLVCKCLGCSAQGAAEPKAALATRSAKAALFVRLAKAVFGSGDPPAEINSLAQLCEIGFWPSVTEGVDISFSLLAAMLGKTPTLGPGRFDDLAQVAMLPAASPADFDLSYQALRPDGGSAIRAEGFDREIADMEQLLSITSRSSGKRKIQRELTEGLRASSSAPLSGSIVRLLTDYLCALVVTQKRRASTFRTYASRLLHPLALAFGDLDIRSLSADDLEGLYEIALDQKLTTTSRLYCARVLGAMHQFGVRHPDYRLPQLSESLGEGSKRYTIVRALIPSASLVQEVTNSLKSQGLQGSLLATIVLLAFRSGLRIGEVCKLRVRDIQFTDGASGIRSVIWIWVRQSKYGENKTESARRKIPLSALMTDDELNGFQIFLNRTLAGRSRDANELLFTDPSSRLQLDPMKTSAAIMQVLREIDPTKPWTFHSLRHGALNAVHAALEGEDQICQTLFGWKLENCQNVRAAILGENDNDVRAYHALAKFAGHASVGQTWASYLHLLPWLVASKRDAGGGEVPLATLAAATGIALRTLREREVRKSDEVARLMGPRFRKLVQSKPVVRGVPAETSPMVGTSHALSMSLLEGVLNASASGGSPSEIARRFGVPQSFAEEIISVAASTLDVRGARGHARLAQQPATLYEAVCDEEEVQFLKPPRTAQAHQLAGQIFDQLIAAPSNRARHLEIIKAVFEGINAQDSEIRFFEPQNLKAVIGKVASLLPAHLWKAEIRRRPGRGHALALRRWRAALGEGALLHETLLPAHPSGTPETPAGTALVRIYLPDDPKEGPARGTAALKYAAVLALIALTAQANLEPD
jgi:integrase